MKKKEEKMKKKSLNYKSKNLQIDCGKKWRLKNKFKPKKKDKKKSIYKK